MFNKHYKWSYFTHTEYWCNTCFHLYIASLLPFTQSTKYIFLIYFHIIQKKQLWNCLLFFVYLTSKFTCISQTHARLLVKNSHVTLFHGHSSSILTHHVPRGVLPARVFIGSIKVSAATDLAAGRTTSTDTLTLNILTCNVTTKLAFTFNLYLSIYLFILIFISFRRKRDKHIKIFHFDVDDCSVGLYIF